MPKFDKPDSPNIIWGVNALEDDLTRPDDSYIETGWTQVKPPYEYENYSMNKLYQGFAYYNQLGFPEWDSVTEYQAGKSYVQASNNRVYKCIQTHTNRNPASAGNESWWETFEGNRQATTTVRGTVELATSQETISGVSDALSVTPASLSSRTATTNRTGLVELATNNEASQGTSNTLAITPSNLLSTFSVLFGSLESGRLEIPVTRGGVRQDFLLQWGSIEYNDISGEREITINFPLVFSGGVFHSGMMCHTLQTNGVIVNVLELTTSSVKARLIEQDTENEGGFLRWFAFGVK